MAEFILSATKEGAIMRGTVCFLFHVGLLMIAGRLCCQGPPPTPERVLREAGIALDNDSLIQALYDNRVGILANAAAVLAERGNAKAVPSIDSQMKAAQDKQLILTLAQSLNTLGSSDGTKQLEAFCLGKEVDSSERMRAAYALVYTRNYGCLPMIPEFLRSDHQDERQAALLYLLKIPSPQRDAPGTLGPALLAIASMDPIKQFRSLAKEAIRQIGDPDTRDALLKSSPKDSK
jgi:HEAT repeat protein